MRYNRYMYNKLFSKIITSSIWLAPDPTRIIWITLLATMDQDGIATYASVANLAHTARVDFEQTKEAVAILEGPDPDSSDTDNDGRRIERLPGGWLVLNAEKYRKIVSREVARERTRERVAKHRARKAGVTVTDVTKANVRVTPSESYSDADSETESFKSSESERNKKKLRTFTKGFLADHQIAEERYDK